MFHRDIYTRARIIFAATFFVFPALLSAQHGGGGRIGGASAGGTGLNGGNHATGIDEKDDLRDFHEIMAVQATNEQKVAYAAMLKSTALARALVQNFIDQAGKENNASEFAARAKDLADAVDMARTLNKKFLEGFSETQKSGLKEMIKRLGKAESEIGQQSRALDQAFETKLASAQLAGVAAGLGRGVELFQHEQIGLGEEMSIETANGSQEIAYNLPPVKSTVIVADQAVSVVTSGVVSKSAAEGGQNSFAVEITADITDLQHSVTEVLRGQLNRANRCGERIEIATAALTPEQPASLLTAQLHYERWTCNPMLGRDDMTEIVEGNGTIVFKFTLAVAEDGTLQLKAGIERVDAGGLLGELLRSGSLGETLRDKTSASMLAVLNQNEFKAALPPGTQSFATLGRAQFRDVGAGRMMAVMDGEIRVSNDQLAALTTVLKQSAKAESSVVQPELMTR
jgi:hypothetical protein